MHLQWHITERCNFRCKHCYVNDKYIKNELNTEQLLRILDDWLYFCNKLDVGYRKLSLTGGEPLLRKDFFGLLEKIDSYKEQGLIDEICVMTNGSTITDSVAKKFVQFGVTVVQISVEGTEKINDSIRGKGNFKKALRGTKILLKHKIPLVYSMTVTRKNVNEIGPLARIAAKLGINGMGIGRLVPLGRGEEYKDLMLTPLEVRKLYRDLEKINDRLKKDNYNFKVDLHCSDSLYCTVNPDFRTHGCSTPYDVFTLLPNGDLIPCRRLPIKIGNVLEKSFLELHYSSNKLWQIRNQENINDLCKKCNYFNICRGAGKCLAYGYFGTPFAPDPGCWHLANFLNKKFDEKDSNKVAYNEKYIDNCPNPLDKVKLEELKKEKQVIKIKDLDYIKKLKSNLIIFNLNKEDLNYEVGNKIINFLTNLKQANVNFKVAKPLPPCLFGLKYATIAKKFGIPISCKDCLDLFKVKNNKIVLCDGKEGPYLKYMNSREQIHEYFELISEEKPREEKKPLERCKECIYNLRGMCAFKCYTN